MELELEKEMSLSVSVLVLVMLIFPKQHFVRSDLEHTNTGTNELDPSSLRLLYGARVQLLHVRSQKFLTVLRSANYGRRNPGRRVGLCSLEEIAAERDASACCFTLVDHVPEQTENPPETNRGGGSGASRNGMPVVDPDASVSSAGEDHGDASRSTSGIAVLSQSMNSAVAPLAASRATNKPSSGAAAINAGGALLHLCSDKFGSEWGLELLLGSSGEPHSTLACTMHSVECDHGVWRMRKVSRRDAFLAQDPVRWLDVVVPVAGNSYLQPAGAGARGSSSSDSDLKLEPISAASPAGPDSARGGAASSFPGFNAVFVLVRPTSTTTPPTTAARGSSPAYPYGPITRADAVALQHVKTLKVYPVPSETKTSFARLSPVLVSVLDETMLFRDLVERGVGRMKAAAQQAQQNEGTQTGGDVVAHDDALRQLLRGMQRASSRATTSTTAASTRGADKNKLASDDLLGPLRARAALDLGVVGLITTEVLPYLSSRQQHDPLAKVVIAATLDYLRGTLAVAPRGGERGWGSALISVLLELLPVPSIGAVELLQLLCEKNHTSSKPEVEILSDASLPHIKALLLGLLKEASSSTGRSAELQHARSLLHLCAAAAAKPRSQSQSQICRLVELLVTDSVFGGGAVVPKFGAVQGPEGSLLTLSWNTAWGPKIGFFGSSPSSLYLTGGTSTTSTSTTAPLGALLSASTQKEDGAGCRFLLSWSAAVLDFYASLCEDRNILVANLLRDSKNFFTFDLLVALNEQLQSQSTPSCSFVVESKELEAACSRLITNLYVDHVLHINLEAPVEVREVQNLPKLSTELSFGRCPVESPLCALWRTYTTSTRGVVGGTGHAWQPLLQEDAEADAEVGTSNETGDRELSDRFLLPDFVLSDSAELQTLFKAENEEQKYPLLKNLIGNHLTAEAGRMRASSGIISSCTPTSSSEQLNLTLQYVRQLTFLLDFGFVRSWEAGAFARVLVEIMQLMQDLELGSSSDLQTVEAVNAVQEMICGCLDSIHKLSIDALVTRLAQIFLAAAGAPPPADSDRTLATTTTSNNCAMIASTASSCQRPFHPDQLSAEASRELLKALDEFLNLHRFCAGSKTRPNGDFTRVLLRQFQQQDHSSKILGLLFDSARKLEQVLNVASNDLQLLNSPEESQLYKRIQKLVVELQALLEGQPVWTRSAFPRPVGGTTKTNAQARAGELLTTLRQLCSLTLYLDRRTGGRVVGKKPGVTATDVGNGPGATSSEGWGPIIFDSFFPDSVAQDMMRALGLRRILLTWLSTQISSTNTPASSAPRTSSSTSSSDSETFELACLLLAQLARGHEANQVEIFDLLWDSGRELFAAAPLLLPLEQVFQNNAFLAASLGTSGLFPEVMAVLLSGSSRSPPARRTSEPESHELSVVTSLNLLRVLRNLVAVAGASVPLAKRALLDILSESPSAVPMPGYFYHVDAETTTAAESRLRADLSAYVGLFRDKLAGLDPVLRQPELPKVLPREGEMNLVVYVEFLKLLAALSLGRDTAHETLVHFPIAKIPFTSDFFLLRSGTSLPSAIACLECKYAQLSFLKEAYYDCECREDRSLLQRTELVFPFLEAVLRDCEEFVVYLLMTGPVGNWANGRKYFVIGPDLGGGLH
eukprot:g15520.t1